MNYSEHNTSLEYLSLFVCSVFVVFVDVVVVFIAVVVVVVVVVIILSGFLKRFVIKLYTSRVARNLLNSACGCRIRIGFSWTSAVLMALTEALGMLFSASDF